MTCEEVPKYEFVDGCDKKSVEVSFNELVMGAVYQVPHKIEDSPEHNPKLPEKELDIYVEKAYFSDEITANEELWRVADLFENSSMPVKIHNCVTKREKSSRTVPGKWKKIFKFRKKTRLKKPRKTCAQSTFKRVSPSPQCM